MEENDNKEVIVIIIFLGQCCPSGKGAMRLTLFEAVTSETRPSTTWGTTCPRLPSVILQRRVAQKRTVVGDLFFYDLMRSQLQSQVNGVSQSVIL